jgi:glucokinase
MSERICGVDLGGTKIEVVIVNGDRKVRGQCRAATPTENGPESVVGAIIAAVTGACADAGCSPKDLKGIGIGAPGAVNAARGILLHAPNLAGFEEAYPLAERVGAACGAKVRLGNDVGVAVLGELELGAGRKLDSFVGIWWGTGVGSGIVLNRRLWHGRGAAGELGHTVIQRGGLAEPSGLVGTMEAYAGRRNMETRARAAAAAGRSTVLFDLMREAGKERLSSRVWQEALEAGDGLAAELIGEAVDAIAAAAANVVNILDVDAIILGGGLGTRFGQPMADRIGAAMAPYLFQPAKAPPVTTAALGDLGGAIGATLLVGARR